MEQLGRYLARYCIVYSVKCKTFSTVCCFCVLRVNDNFKWFNVENAKYRDRCSELGFHVSQIN